MIGQGEALDGGARRGQTGVWCIEVVITDFVPGCFRVVGSLIHRGSRRHERAGSVSGRFNNDVLVKTSRGKGNGSKLRVGRGSAEEQPGSSDKSNFSVHVVNC